MPPHTPLTAFANGGTPTIESVAKLLATDQIRNVVVLAGAGISTSSGIPDFRSPDTGLYANLARYNLPYPEAIFEIGYFQTKPQAFFQLAKELYPGNFAPTLTHYFLRLLDEKGKLLRIFTQNIDTLERIAGVPADRIVEAHGSFATSRCLRCQKEVEPDWIKELCMKGQVAHCPEAACQKKSADGKGGLVKPDIVFFGEGLPSRFFSQLDDLKQADLLITMGTSLQVHPFASLIDRVRPSCPRLLINLERVGDIGGEDQPGGSSTLRGLGTLFRESGFDFDGLAVGRKNKDKIRDVFFQGRTDEGVRILAKECGWEKDLDKLWEQRADVSAKAEPTPSLSGSVETAKEVAQQVAEADRKATRSGSNAAEDSAEALADALEAQLKVGSGGARPAGKGGQPERSHSTDTSKDAGSRSPQTE
ncbi:unnamed protein product [Parajaminaea phylloscopi]